MGLFNLARAFVFPALTRCLLISTETLTTEPDLPSAHIGKSAAGYVSTTTLLLYAVASLRIPQFLPGQMLLRLSVYILCATSFSYFHF